jgi:transposase
MLTFSPTQRIYLAIEPVDMRKHFDGLWALASEKLQEDPFSGSLFVFTNKSHDRLKILFWDGSGVWVLAKRLECQWSLENRPGVVTSKPATLKADWS